MSSEDPGSYSDVRSNSSNEIITASDNSRGQASEPHAKLKAQSRSLFRSESIFLALLFALVALLLPTFFSFASTPSPATEGRESPLKALFPYIPTLTTAFRVSLSTSQVILRPFVSALSLFLALLAPIFLTMKLLYKILVLLPSRIVAEVVRFLYPIYLFCGVACLFGAGIGLGGRLVVEGSRLLLVQDHRKQSKRRTRIP